MRRQKSKRTNTETARQNLPHDVQNHCSSWGCKRIPKSLDLSKIWAISEKKLGKEVPTFPCYL